MLKLVNEMIKKFKLKVIFYIFKKYVDYLLIIKKRNFVEKKLNILFNSKIYDKKISKDYKKCLIDATYDGPNYWFRLGILRAALESPFIEYAVISRFNRFKIKKTLKNFGIRNFFDIGTNKIIDKKYIKQAEKIFYSLSSPKDLLNIKLPYDAPTIDLYDSLLKFQRNSTLNINDKNLIKYISRYLKDLDKSKEIIDIIKPDLAILSHTTSGRVNNGVLTWHLTRNKIPIIVPNGSFGNFAHYKIFEYSDHFNHVNRPSKKDMEIKDKIKLDKLKKIGAEYINRRLNGKAKDLGAELAFPKDSIKISRNRICKEYLWDDKKPLVAVFASIWFDNPHTFGMNEYIDFNDWLNFTYKAACENNNVNWLFKAHPSEDWYGGGTRMIDLFPKVLPNHIKIANKNWNGSDFRNAIDAVVTLHGTIGVEMSSFGKPVLVATNGWYGDLGFVKLSNSRKSYEKDLKSNWWENFNIQKNKKLSNIFAGYYFCIPKENNSIFLESDANQFKLYESHKDILINNKELINKEILTMQKWLKSDDTHYHIFKMRNSDDFKFAKNI